MKPRAPGRGAVFDLLVAAAFAAAVFVLAGRFEWFEAYGRATRSFERWQLDEVFFGLLALSLGLAWFAWRRWREAVHVLAMHRGAQHRIEELLARNRELSQRLIELQESERARLARELHDELGQRCNAIQVDAALIRCAAAPDSSIAATAGRIGGAAQALYEQVRAMLRRLRPADLDALGLTGALESLCEQRDAGPPRCHFQARGSFADLTDAAQVAVYRVAQEALTNARRHAGANRIEMRLERDPQGGVQLEVRDDGCGFDPAMPRRGLGLLGASERAALLNGRLDVHSGAGTTLTLRLPPARVTA